MSTTVTPNEPVQTPPPSVAVLTERWATLLADQPGLRIRNAADALGVSELELLLTRVGDTVTRLEGDLEALVHRLPELGRVMALTRNASAVHEAIGTYGGVGFEHHMGVVHHDNIDLRLFMHRWCHAVAVAEPVRDHVRRSLQIFDAHGTAIHKVYLRPRSNEEAWHAIVEAFRAPEQSPRVEVEPAPQPAVERADTEVDVEAFQAAWHGMQDTHDFFPLMRKHHLTRRQAIRLAPEGMVSQVGPDALAALLASAVREGVEIMVFVGNRGAIQIYTGPIENVRPLDGWLNIMDPRFTLHLRDGDIAQTWIVRKPTRDGIVTALEVFDEAGELIVQLFGERKPERPERESWRAIVEALTSSSPVSPSIGDGAAVE